MNSFDLDLMERGQGDAQHERADAAANHFTGSHLPLLCVVQSTGLLPASLDVPYTADLLLAPLRAGIFRFQRDVREFSLSRISRGLTAILAALSLQ